MEVLLRMEIVEMLLQNGNTKIRNCNGWPLPASVEEIKHALMSLLELVSIENANTLTEPHFCIFCHNRYIRLERCNISCVHC